MSSVVYQSASMQALRLALVSQSISEEPTGLVTASVGYTTLPEYRNRISPLFVVDNEPPMYPSAISRDELLTNRLYLRDRVIEQSNGLVHISATYVGGLNRGGDYVYCTLEPESDKTVTFISDPFTIQIYNGQGLQSSVVDNATNGYTYTFSRIVATYEFVGVGDQFSYTARTLPQIAKLSSYSGSFWTNSGNKPFPESFFVGEVAKRIKQDRKETFQTPLVRTITIRHFAE